VICTGGFQTASVIAKAITDPPAMRQASLGLSGRDPNMAKEMRRKGTDGPPDVIAGPQEGGRLSTQGRSEQGGVRLGMAAAAGQPGLKESLFQSHEASSAPD
jgi:hypothetical protein